MPPIRIAHVITGLTLGGAQAMLAKLLSQTDRGRYDPIVVSLRKAGGGEPLFESLGVPICTLGMTGANAAFATLRLVAWLRRERPGLVHTWMYHADLVGGLAARGSGRPPVVWGLRQTDLLPGLSRLGSICTMRLCAHLSGRVPARIVCCSEATRRVHVALGYDPSRMVVIPNGFDLDAFRPRPEARDAVRSTLGVRADAPLIGLVARFDPQKDHRTFLQAATVLHARRPDAHFLLCGEGTGGQGALGRWVSELGLERNCHRLGPRAEVAWLTAALDLACSSSAFGEGFSNAVAEAMACGVPCVVTDVGGSREIVGDTGRVVPARDHHELASAWSELLAMPAERRRSLGRAARQRIATRFDLPSIARRYQELYEQCLSPLRSQVRDGASGCA